MSNLIVPGQPQKPTPGVQFNLTVDGPMVLVQIVMTLAMKADEASGFAVALGQAASQAKATEQAVISTLTNGHRLNIIP